MWHGDKAIKALKRSSSTSALCKAAPNKVTAQTLQATLHRRRSQQQLYRANGLFKTATSRETTPRLEASTLT
jgi:hypothetical protein